MWTDTIFLAGLTLYNRDELCYVFFNIIGKCLILNKFIIIGIALGITAYSEVIAEDKNIDKVLTLSKSETQWLAAHPVIRFSPDPDYPPIESLTKDGQYEGIAAEYLSLVEKKLGITFKLIRSKSWDEVLLKAKNKEIDLLPAATSSPQRLEFLNFTAPHIIIPGVILVRDHTVDSLSLTDLYGEHVSFVSGYIWQDFISKDHPQIKQDPVPDIKAGLLKVSFGETPAMIANLATASYYIKKTGITNIRVAGESGYFAGLAFATRKDWPELNSILQKALSSITTDEKNKISDRWISLNKEDVLSTEEIATLLFIIIVIVLLAFIWNRTLREAIQRKVRELDESEQFNRMLFENTPIGLALSDMDGKLVEVNHAFADITRYNIDELKKLSYWDLTPKKYEKQELIQLDSLEATGKYGPYEKEYIHKNGSLIPVRLSGQIIERDGKKFIWSSVENILEKKKYEKNLEQSKELLEQEVKIRTEEYKLAKEEADAANMAKSQFLSSMSHELRTPLNAIIGFSQLLEMDAKDDLTKENLHEIITAGDHLLELINEVLDLARIESGKVDLSIESHNINKIINNSLSLIRPLADKHSIQIDNKLNDSVDINIMTDEMRFKQVLLNILSNAIKYNNENGTVTLDYSLLDDNMFYLSVTDTGNGLTAEQQSQLFKSFERLGAEESNIEGTGLGLAISKDLIELMDGTIGVESEIGKGSCFWVKIPMA